MREHWAAIDADLARYYGLAITDVGGPKLPWVRLARLLEWLPPGNALTRSELGRAETRWSETDHLIAATIDVLREANWQRAGDETVRHPGPIERPEQSAQRERARQRVIEGLRRLNHGRH